MQALCLLAFSVLQTTLAGLANYFVLFPAIVLPMILKKLPIRDRHFLSIAMVVCYLIYSTMEMQLVKTFRKSSPG